MMTQEQIDCRIQMALNCETYQFKRVELQRLCNEIQQDARHSALSEAAGIVPCPDCKEQIIALRDKKEI